jgi:hypothetical protein
MRSSRFDPKSLPGWMQLLFWLLFFAAMIAIGRAYGADLGP